MALLSRTATGVLCVVVFFMCSFNAAASDDAYLKMLNGEAENVTLDESGKIDNNEQTGENARANIVGKNWNLEGNLEDDIVPKSLSQEEFTSFLKQRFYGTYVFYRKLSTIDRETVYYHYAKATSVNLDSVREDIISLLKN